VPLPVAVLLLEHVSPIDWDNVVLYGQYILDRKLVRQRGRAMRTALSLDLIPKGV
jgi:hypothetical protein